MFPWLLPPVPHPPDLLLVNGHVVTMDPALPQARAVAVRDGLVVWVGSDREARLRRGPATRVVDLGGDTLLPGLVDAHAHLLLSATQLLDVDLYGVTTLQDLEDALREGARARPTDPWIRGVGWDLGFLSSLDRDLLDRIVPDRPVYLESGDGHAAVVNSAALAAAGIPELPGAGDADSGIVRDPQGRATGLLLEAGVERVSAVLPPWPDAQVDQALQNGVREFLSHGITTVIEATCDPWVVEGYLRADARGALPLHVRCNLAVDPSRGPEQVEDLVALRTRGTSPHLDSGGAKLYLDGVLETGTAVMVEPYRDGTNGVPAFTDPALRDLAVALDARGFQLHAHTLGDGATRQMLDALEHVRQVAGERDRRPILTHLEVVAPADLPRFRDLGAIAAFQPLWAWPDEAIVDLTWPVLDPEPARWLYPIGALARAGGTWVGSSDWSVTTMDPWPAMEVAVTRRDPWGWGGQALTPAHRVTVRDALEAYTVRGARAAFLEDVTGAIRPGLSADLVRVHGDPLRMAPRRLDRVEVITVWFEGSEVWRED